ncbi:MAG: hypothetical protein G3M78_04555 [Candidatus Nitrohelix vancouverensis]|uniref:Uncharacterized protein n=1 Tax=Candidatus Nitrohelix vancouverensis TaxID=2705534 RepID=A0A7T0G2V7_9BACT|nr:MAG: hypothetical protein G3M78_04555 [Candidatus Nitrohelix vancouverensis]
MTLLKPGDTTICSNSMRIQNPSDDLASVQVILGNGVHYSFDQLEPKETREYSLTADYMSSGWENGKGVKISDARVVNVSGGEGHLVIDCG